MVLEGDNTLVKSRVEVMARDLEGVDDSRVKD